MCLPLTRLRSTLAAAGFSYGPKGRSDESAILFVSYETHRAAKAAIEKPIVIKGVRLMAQPAATKGEKAAEKAAATGAGSSSSSSGGGGSSSTDATREPPPPPPPGAEEGRHMATQPTATSALPSLYVQPSPASAAAAAAAAAASAAATAAAAAA